MTIHPGKGNGPQGIPMKNGAKRDPGYDPVGTNEKYETAGQLGSYCTREEPWPTLPEGAKVFTGFGADLEDVQRGYCDPHVRELPDYDAINYRDRYTVPKVSDEDDTAGGGTFGVAGATERDFEFRQRERVSKGFFTRPRIPTDR